MCYNRGEMKVNWIPYSENKPPSDKVVWLSGVDESGVFVMVGNWNIALSALGRGILGKFTHWAEIDWPDPPKDMKSWAEIGWPDLPKEMI